MKNICVFASSSDKLADIYNSAARELGAAIAKANMGVVFGAGDGGLMGSLARSAHANGGKVIGVIPDSLNVQGIVYPHCDTLYDTRTMHERKSTKMASILFRAISSLDFSMRRRHSSFLI